MICTACGCQGAVKSRKHDDWCQFCWDCLQHELRIVLDSIRDLGQYNKFNRGPGYFAIYYTGDHTLGLGFWLATTPAEAMATARRMEQRNNWKLLRVDVQRTLKDIFVSPEYGKYMPGTNLKPVAFNG